MNILHLKYALEIEKTHSISKAAENLFMGQPNLSRAVRELENDIGTEIFTRSAKGMEVTPQGEEFLRYARRLLRQMDELETMFRSDYEDKQRFSVSVPRASYIAHAFAQFAKSIDSSKPAEILYKETNSLRAINNILNAGYRLGIIRYANNYGRYFKEMLEEKKLDYELIAEFCYVVIMSQSHPLAQKKEITYDDLAPYTEIAHADPFVPSLPTSEVIKEELPDNIRRRIYVFERASQFDLLCDTPGTFMWVSPLPDELLERYSLVQKKCVGNTRVYRDVLIHRNGYKLSALDDIFVSEVIKAKRDYL